MQIKNIAKNKKGFTLIELLLVIAIIAILALLIFVALDPATRFEDARDSRRFSDVNNILSAAKVDQVDNRGTYFTNLENATNGIVYMVGDCTAGNASSTVSGFTCDTAITTSSCLNANSLVTDGYLASVPISPTGVATWTASSTGYTVTKASTGALTIRACESENTTEIYLAR